MHGQTYKFWAGLTPCSMHSLAATPAVFLFFAVSFRKRPFESSNLNMVCRCPQKVWSAKYLNWPIVTRVHVPRRVKISSEFQIFEVLLVCVTLQADAVGFDGEFVTVSDYGYVITFLILSISTAHVLRALMSGPARSV